MNKFNSLDKSYLEQRKITHEICRLFAKSPSKGNLKRIKGLFAQCGDGVIIEAGFHFDYGSQVQIGDRTFININCTMLDAPINEGAISIGDDCLIGPNVQLLTVSHAVVGAGSVVTKDIAANTVVAGNPAVKIKDI